MSTSRMCSMMDLSTRRRSSTDHAKKSLLSRRKWMRSASILPSSIAEMMTCLQVLPSNSGTFLVSSAGFALACCSGSFGEGILTFGFSLPRLCTFFYPRVAVCSAILGRSWLLHMAMMPLAEGSFIQRLPGWRTALKMFVTPRSKIAL